MSWLFSAVRTLETDIQRRNTLNEQDINQAKHGARERDPESFVQDGSAHRFEPGMVYLGCDGQGRDVGAYTKKHLLTVGECRSGKDQCSVLQNLWKNPSNFCVVDPKSEGADETAVHRETAFGQEVYVIDPCGVAKVPDRMRVNFNPMAGLSADDPFILERLSAISNGLILREGAKGDPFWKNAAEGVIKGILAWQLLQDPDKAGMPWLKWCLSLPGDPEDHPGEDDENDQYTFGELCAAMEENDHPVLGNTIRAAPKFLYGKPGDTVLTEINTETAWLDFYYMREGLASTSVAGGKPFSFSLLKERNVTIYIVIPRDKLTEYARFLRLMLSLAINAMAEGGDSDRDTIFVMNEFYALGHLKKVAEMAGALPSAGVKFWPILQNWSQMTDRYGGGADTFYGSCGIKEFMGNDDDKTLEFVSKQLGNNPVSRERLMNPRQVKEHVAPEPLPEYPDTEIARRKLVFLSKKEHVLSVIPRPFFLDR